jgi:broad specificity phosphatase PhoE
VFEAATGRWTAGDNDHDYHESFPAFRRRVDAALRRSADRAGAAGTVVVVSSGGPIGLASALLVTDDEEQARLAALWAAFNRVAVNTGVTKVIGGRRGLSLSTYNEHTHLENDRRLITYR